MRPGEGGEVERFAVDPDMLAIYVGGLGESWENEHEKGRGRGARYPHVEGEAGRGRSRMTKGDRLGSLMKTNTQIVGP